MNDKKRKALLENLEKDRQIEDDYLEGRPRRILLMVIFLLIVIALVVFININGKEKESKEVNIYENDNTKLFSKDFINSVRYGYFIRNNEQKEYNCNYDKETVDKLTKECVENKHLNKCNKFDDNKQYCFSFIKGNVEMVETLNIFNPEEVDGLKEFTNLKSINVELDENYTKYNNLFAELNTLTSSKSELSVYVFIDDFADELLNIDTASIKDYKNINICLFDKDICNMSGIFISYQDMIKVINIINGIKNDLYNEFKNPSDLEKVIFVYNYMINNLRVDDAATLNEDNISRENMKDILDKKLVSHLALNEVGTYYSLTNYFDILSKSIGLKTSIASYIDNSTKKEYIYNEIKISDKWYNISIEKEIINLKDETKLYNYFLKSDSEFETSLGADIKNNHKSDVSVETDKINSIISKIR